MVRSFKCPEAVSQASHLLPPQTQGLHNWMQRTRHMAGRACVGASPLLVQISISLSVVDMLTFFSLMGNTSEACDALLYIGCSCSPRSAAASLFTTTRSKHIPHEHMALLQRLPIRGPNVWRASWKDVPTTVQVHHLSPVLL